MMLSQAKPSQASRVGSGTLRVRVERGPVRAVFDGLLSVAAIAAVGIGILSFRLPLFSSFLYAPQAAYQFGTVSEGQTVNHLFVVRNLHPWSVTVKDVKGGCGCTRTVVERDPPFVLAPLEAVTIRASLDTAHKNGPTEQVIHVVTSDNEIGSPLVLQGTVLPAASPASSLSPASSPVKER